MKEDLIVKEQLKKYPYLKNYTKYTLFVNLQELEEIHESEEMEIEIDKNNTKTFNIDYLIKILTEERYFSYVQKYFNKEIDCFLKMSIEKAYGILRDLKIDENDLRKVYIELI